jgi:hypothetical protein
MRHAEIELNSLAVERQRLLDCIFLIRGAGSAALSHCWLITSSEEKGSRTCTYIKLITERPGKKQPSKSLGRPGSDRHWE